MTFGSSIISVCSGVFTHSYSILTSNCLLFALQTVSSINITIEHIKISPKPDLWLDMNQLLSASRLIGGNVIRSQRNTAELMIGFYYLCWFVKLYAIWDCVKWTEPSDHISGIIPLSFSMYILATGFEWLDSIAIFLAIHSNEYGFGGALLILMWW